MSKQTKQFFEQIKSGESLTPTTPTPPTLAEQVKEAAGNAKAIGGQIWDGMKPMFDHGRSELAAALFAGHAHVMYMRGQDGVGPDKGQEPPEREIEGREI